jgi:hypothetical protein
MEPTPVINSHFLEDGEHHASLAKPIAADAPSTTAIALPIPETNSPRNQNKRSAQSRNLSLPTHQKKIRPFYHSSAPVPPAAQGPAIRRCRRPGRRSPEASWRIPSRPRGGECEAAAGGGAGRRSAETAAGRG